MRKENTVYILILLCAAVVLGLFLVFRHKPKIAPLSSHQSKFNNSITNRVAFECAGDKSLTAIFYPDGTVDINLADETKKVIDNEKLAESDSRFYSKDKSLVFWTEGDEQMSTFIQKDGVITEHCKFLTFIE